MRSVAPTFAVVLAFVLSTGFARAAEEEASEEAEQNEMLAIFVADADTDKDGKLSLLEFAQHEAVDVPPSLGGLFAAADTDGDGSLDTKEVRKMFELIDSEAAQERVEELLEETDADKDGKVSLAEVQATLSEELDVALNDTLKEHFAVADTNGDSILEAAEMTTFVQIMEKEDPGKDDAAEGEDELETQNGEDEELTPGTVLAVMDTDNDGKLTLAELRKEIREDGGAVRDLRDHDYEAHFAAADLNGDSLLEGAEISTMISRLSAQGHMAMFDTDKDGKVSAAELEDQVKAAGELENLVQIQGYFHTADANGDSFLDLSEIGSFLNPKH